MIFEKSKTGKNSCWVYDIPANSGDENGIADTGGCGTTRRTLSAGTAKYSRPHWNTQYLSDWLRSSFWFISATNLFLLFQSVRQTGLELI